MSKLLRGSFAVAQARQCVNSWLNAGRNSRVFTPVPRNQPKMLRRASVMVEKLADPETIWKMAHPGKTHSMALPITAWYIGAGIVGFLLLPLFIPFSNLMLVVIPTVTVVTLIHFFFYSYPQWPLKTRIRQYITSRIFHFYGMYLSWQYHNDSKKLHHTQEQTLLALLKENATTQYSTDHNLGNITSIEDFRERHPIIKYEYIRPYVEREMQGTRNQLTKRKPTYFGKTSGTTGSPSIVPHTRFTGLQQLGNLALFMYNADNKVQWSELHWMRPVWKASYTPPRIIEKTESGVLRGPVTANPIWTKMGEIYTVPSIAFQIEDAGAGGYVQILFALRFRELGAIEGIFASLVYFAFQRMESEWKDLVNDIRHGTLKPDPKVPLHIRQELLKHLRPDAQRADELEIEFNKGFEGIGSRLWPELGIINCITTGAFAIYAKYLREFYCKGILLYSTCLASTEGFLGANFWPFNQPIPRYSILPRTHFYEFIPLEEISKPDPETVLADELRIGSDYELVITTGSGLCRYRMGDLIRVVSFYNQVPLFEFVSRASAMLSSKGEKITEELIYSCLSIAEKELKAAGKLERIADYSSCESVLMEMVKAPLTQKGSHHIYFVEMVPTKPDADVKELAKELAEKIDHEIAKRHFRYKELREINSLSPPVVAPVKAEAFHRLKEYMQMTSTASFAQIKIPRVLAKQELLKFLLNERL
ncbi:uncharacterized protein LOC129600997 [Paramacrobiotus metropolitanus]|uniref:uncharacterized protein LOC129600997 n=1 Tax=Paramacrobiotus metropolitanus TaxID=2943436 RepID=UPI00244602E7|nr:uncharacterized protein LOC129600997 [Paramacrobiotus metropolitanus]